MKIELVESLGYYLLFKNKKILIDFKQFEKLYNDSHIWHEEDTRLVSYPYYNKTQAIQENIVEYFYTKLYDIKYKNNDNYDLRVSNCIKIQKQTKYDTFIRQKYNVIDYIPGHCRTNSPNSLYNMVWITIEANNEDLLNSPTYYLMYCEENKVVKLTKEQYDQVMEYNKKINYTLTWFHHTRRDTNNSYIIAKFNKSIIQLNTIISTFNKTNIITLFDMPIMKNQEYNPFKKIDKEVRENNNVISVIKGHFKNSGQMANIERNRIWILDTHYLMIAEKNTLVKLCETSYKKILEYEEKICDKITWHKLKNGYIGNTKTGLMMHQVIMNHYGHGQGTGNKTSNEHQSIDHIDRDPTNNTMANLRLATREEQEQNSKGIMSDSKRARKHNAQPLPDGFTHEMMPKYVTYYNECYNKDKGLYREFLKIEKHPMLDKIWTSSKSNKVTLMDKLKSAKDMLSTIESIVL